MEGAAIDGESLYTLVNEEGSKIELFINDISWEFSKNTYDKRPTVAGLYITYIMLVRCKYIDVTVLYNNEKTI